MNKFIKPAISAALAISIGISSIGVYGGNSKFFVDVNESSYSWASDYVDIIASRQIASGVGDNRFDPGSPIKRGDFAVFLDRTFNFTLGNPLAVIYVDISEDDYYYQSIINGYVAGAITDKYNYYPEDSITRIDAIKMIYNALNVQNLIGSNLSNTISMYSDSNLILNEIDKIAVGTLSKIGIISGNNGMLYPNDTLTRAEMAVVFAKTALYVDEARAKIEEDNAAKLEQQIEDERADVVVEDDVENIKSGNVDSPIVIDSGNTVAIHDVTIDIPNQETNAINISNGSDVTFVDSTLRNNSAQSAILLSDDSSIDVENVSVECSGTEAVKLERGSSLDAENMSLKVSGTSVLSMEEGTSATLNGGTIRATGNYTDIFSIVSDIENSRDKVYLNLNDISIDNTRINLLGIRESDADITIKDSDISVYKLINSPYDRKNIQTNGNNITLTIEGSNVRGDIDIDNKTSLSMYILEDGVFNGFINKDLYSTDVNIYLTYDGRLELMSDIYVNDFVTEDGYFNNIVDNGFNIYYDDTREANSYLYSEEYNLTYGGRLLPQ